MVTEYREGMNKMFDQMAESLRASMEVGKKMQNSWFEAASFGKNGGEMNRFFGQNEKVAKEWLPFVERTMKTCSESACNSFEANLGVFKKATSFAAKGAENDVNKNSREMFDAGFSAMRSNMDTMAATGKKVMDDWATFCHAECFDFTPAKKSPSKETK